MIQTIRCHYKSVEKNERGLQDSLNELSRYAYKIQFVSPVHLGNNEVMYTVIYDTDARLSLTEATKQQLQCRLIEHCLRAMFADGRQTLREYLYKGLNAFLDVDYAESDYRSLWSEIHITWGHCNHDKTMRFIDDGYSMKNF